jgi:hypothetical protein
MVVPGLYRLSMPASPIADGNRSAARGPEKIQEMDVRCSQTGAIEAGTDEPAWASGFSFAHTALYTPPRTKAHLKPKALGIGKVGRSPCARRASGAGSIGSAIFAGVLIL